MAAVMASDSQILALSTMFTEDVFAFYEGTARFGEAVQVLTGRVFVVLVTAVGISHCASRAAEHLRPREPVRVCRVCCAVAAARRRAVLAGQHEVGRAGGDSVDGGCRAVDCRRAEPRAAPPPGQSIVLWSAFGADIVTRGAAGMLVLGMLPVVPMTIISALLMWVVSLLTPRPSPSVIARYFS